VVGLCVFLGSAQIYGNIAKVGLFLKNQPEITGGLIYDAFPVLVTSGTNVFQTIARPDPAHAGSQNIITRMDTRGSLAFPMICGSVSIEDGHPQLLGLAFKSNFDQGKWSTSEDSLWILKPGDSLIYNVEGNLDNWCVMNDNGNLKFKEGEE
jgi:hypothetical protein